MSPQEALAAARASGVEVRLDGKDLIVSAASEPPDDICAVLSRHKPAIVELLQTGSAPVPATTALARRQRFKEQAAAALAAGTGVTGTDINASGDIIASGGTDITDLAAGDTEGSTSANITGPQDIVGSVGSVGSVDTTGSADSAALRQPSLPWDPEEWQALYDETAAISEYDHGMPRPEAEKHALDFCIAEWLYRDAVTSPPGTCSVCGLTDLPNDPLFAIQVGAARAWLHRECGPAWRADRIAEAIAGLGALGITGPQSSS